MNPLSRLLDLPLFEKQERGLLYTPAEIAQQPATWPATHRLFDGLQSDLTAFLRQAHEEKWPICLIGAGTSDYAGRSIANLLRKRWRCEVQVVPSTDLLANHDDLIVPDRKYLWISFSRSGDSPEGVAVLEQALASNLNIRHLVVTCNKNGQMAKLARGNNNCFTVVLDNVVNDRSLAMTSSFTNMVLFGQELAHLWEGTSFGAILDDMMHAAEYFLNEGAELAYKLAQQKYQAGCFVGAGSLAATARESALKMLELTSGGIQTMHESTLGLRHGPMSALNKETLFAAFLSNNPLRRKYDSDLLHEIHGKQIVRTIVTVGGAHDASDYSLQCPALDRLDDAYRPAVDVIFGQLLGLFSSIELGLKPDSPSPRGIINRVVEKFAIYT